MNFKIDINHSPLLKLVILLTIISFGPLNNLFASDNYSETTGDLEELVSEPSIVKQSAEVPRMKADGKKKKIIVAESVLPPTIKADKKKKLITRQEEQIELPTFVGFKLGQLTPSFLGLAGIGPAEDTAPTFELSEDSLSSSRFNLIEDPDETNPTVQHRFQTPTDLEILDHEASIVGPLSRKEREQRDEQQGIVMGEVTKKIEGFFTGKPTGTEHSPMMAEMDSDNLVKVRRLQASHLHGVNPNIGETKVDVGINLLGMNSTTVFDYNHNSGGGVQTLLSSDNFSVSAEYNLKTDADMSGGLITTNTYKTTLAHGGEDYFLEGTAYTATGNQMGGGGSSKSYGGSATAEKSLRYGKIPIKLQAGIQYNSDTTSEGDSGQNYSYNAGITALLDNISVGVEFSQEFNEMEHALIGGYPPGFEDPAMMPQQNSQIMLRLGFQF